jgi:hypothetical protein
MAKIGTIKAAFAAFIEFSKKLPFPRILLN